MERFLRVLRGSVSPVAWKHRNGPMTRRELLLATAAGGVAMAAGITAGPKTKLPERTLGKTGVPVTIFGLGGEGVMRTRGLWDQAAAVIQRALDEGVTYFDTAPAYEDSREYLGRNLGARRAGIFLASKTHARDAEGTKRLIADSLAKLKTDHLDLLQLHDLRDMDELDVIFGKDGAMEALLEARATKLVRFLGITGHTDPDVLAEAMRRHPFDTILTVVNPAEPHGRSFAKDTIPNARKLGMGVIGMKVLARQRLFRVPGTPDAPAALRYAWTRDVDTCIVGCSTPDEVSQNAAAARSFVPLTDAERAALEAAAAPFASAVNPWKIHTS